MHKILVTYIIILLMPQFVEGQSCFQSRLPAAVRSYENGNYNDAVVQLNLVKRICSDANKKELDGWLKKCDTKIDEQRRIAESGTILKGRNRSIVDSLKAIVALKYKWGNESSQVRYIKACTSLGDYYLKANNFKAAVFYYKKVADLTAGTDSPLGENVNAIKLWETTRIKLAELYKEKPSLENDKNKVFGLLDENNGITISQLSEFSEHLFGKDEFLLAHPRKSAIHKDSLELEYLLNPLYVHSHLHTKPLFSTHRNTSKIDGLISQMNLEKVAEYLRNNPELTIKGYVKMYKFNMRIQEYSYYIRDAIINNLFEIYGISFDRINLEIQYPDDNVGNYKGIKVWKVGFVFNSGWN